MPKSRVSPPEPEVKDFERIATGISAAHWCVINPEKKYEFVPAHLGDELTRSGTTSTCWFDELFDGGIQVPVREEGASSRALTIMLSGPPGTGKSTLAMELCYRLAIKKQDAMQSLYLSTEGHPDWLIKHAQQGFNWDVADQVFGSANSNRPVDIRGIQTKKEADDLTKASQPERDRAPHGGPPRVDPIFLRISSGFTKLHINDQAPNYKELWKSRDLIIFDNLNTVDMSEDEWAEFLEKLPQRGPRIVVVILDSSSGDKTARRWEYISDIVIRLGRQYPSGYMIRTIEIIKSRYQHTAFGRQQFKILGKRRVCSAVPLREHPYREEGGVFIFPSIHFFLSRHNLVPGSEDQSRIETPFSVLNTLLGGEGFFSGRCVALTGHRGAHKSRLAYTQLLYTLHKNPNARGILISLGDDERTTRTILENIMVDQFGQEKREVNDLEEKGRLEIAYYPPGLITAYEFFHRVLLSITRLTEGASDKPILLVFSSLEILSTHFPLCAKHSIFIPALIELLGYRHVTSFFVATSDTHSDGRARHDDEDSGLLSMADPILRFERKKIGPKMRYPWLRPGQDPQDLGLNVGTSMVRMRVERFAAGSSAGSEADLLLLRPVDKLAEQIETGTAGKAGLFFGEPSQEL